uniref:Uncharacterized protein n=1 Tax=Arundo donax TaxID=35708 RepID=A0A0A9E8U3_ARUDO
MYLRCQGQQSPSPHCSLSSIGSASKHRMAT